MSWAWTPILGLSTKKRPGGNKDKENQDADGFIKTQNKKRQARNTLGQGINKRVQTQNMYEILQDDKVSNKEDQQTDQAKDHQEKEMDLNIKKHQETAK